MSNTIRIKRRASGNAGAPASLNNAELAFNEVDDVLYYGKGTGGSGGTATTVDAIGGKGAFLSLSGDQTVNGNKTFSGTINVPTPTAAAHAVSKAYADSLVPNVLAGAGIVVATGSGSVTISADDTMATKAYADNAVATGNAGSATKLAAPKTIAATGDATWSASFDGSANASSTLTLANSGVTAGTYSKLTVDAKGRATAGTTLSASDIPSITSAKISDFDTQVRASRLDQMALATASVSMNSQKLTNVADPVSAQDAATKNYVDAVVQGLDPKQSVKVATTANIATLSGAMTIDGIALVAGDRILVKDQTTASQNGLYVVSASAWTRASDADTWAELVSAYVFVEQGTTNADNGFLCSVDAAGTLGTTAVTFVQFSGAGQTTAGAGLTKTGNQLDVGAGTGIAVAADSVGLTGQALALHNLATNGLVARTAADTVAARSIAVSGSGLSVANGDGVSGNPTVTLAAPLSTIGGLTPAADRIPYYTGAAAAALATLTAFGRNLMADLDAAEGRATLGLGTISTQASSAVAITGGSISGLTTFDGVTIDGGTF